MNGVPAGGTPQQPRHVHRHHSAHQEPSSTIPQQGHGTRRLRGSRVSKVLNALKKLPVVNLHRNRSQPARTIIHDRSARPAFARNFQQPTTINPNSARGLLASLGQYSHQGGQGSARFYQRLISPDISYQEVRKLAWDYQNFLPSELNQAAKMAWASRKAITELQLNPGMSDSHIKQSLKQNLRQRAVPEMYIQQALKTIDRNRPETGRPPLPGSALDHTPSLSRAEAVKLQQTYGVTAVPVTLRGKPVAYLLTRTPGKPKDNVLFSCHASAYEQRPKVLKPDNMTIRFVAPRDRILHSTTIGFADAVAKGHARFTTDASQLYAREKPQVTDYYLEGSINTTPETAAAKLFQLEQQGEAVNEFDFLLLDRNVRNLHFSDLMQAFRESGIHPGQMINHHCRPVSKHARGFDVASTINTSEQQRFTPDGIQKSS